MEKPEAPISIDLMTLDNIITSCNDGLKGLNPQPTEFNAKEPIDHSLCDCNDTGLHTELPEQFRKDMPWPLCCKIDKNDVPESKTLDIADITDPCGKTDCRTARDMWYYIEDLVEDDEMVNLDDLVGPCGNTTCNFVKHLKDFIFHRGIFANKISTDHRGCSCTEQMEKALTRNGSCDSICSHECQNLESIFFGSGGCVHKPDSVTKPAPELTETEIVPKPTLTELTKTEIVAKPTLTELTKTSEKVHSTYYLTVELDEKSPVSTPKRSPSVNSESKKQSETKSKYCSQNCPKSDAAGKCSKSACDLPDAIDKQLTGSQSLKCIDSTCPNKEADKQGSCTPSPADSDVEINLAELRNPCNVQACEVADKLMAFIAKGLATKEKCVHHGGNGPCFCDCAQCKPV